MFRLVSPNLTQNTVNNKLAPTFIVWINNYRQTAPILRINCYANWWTNPGWELENVVLEIPFAIGKYWKTTSVSIAKQISLWQKTVDAASAIPDTFWQYENNIYLYQKNLEIPAFLVAEIEVPTPANYIVELAEDFIATSIASEGLIFTSGDGIGSFSQTGKILTIHTNEQVSLEVGQKLSITGELEIGEFEYLSAVVSFYLPNVEYLDRIEWAGHNFSPAKVSASPKVWEFTWNKSQRIANLFLTENSLPYFKESSINKVTEISGSINFNR